MKLPPPTSDINSKSRLSHVLLIDSKSEIPMTFPSDLINVTHRIQGNSLLTRLLVYYKGYNLGTAAMKRCAGQGLGEGAQSSLGAYHPLSNLKL